MSRRALMMSLALVCGCAGWLVAATDGGDREGRGAGAPVLVELFTSEGCSSCPPADDLLRRLVQDRRVDGVEVIAISEHVDYWNRLGWTDPFSSARYSDRQREFAQAFATDEIYTPQIVVDGRLQVVGSDWPALRRAIVEASSVPHASVAVSAARSPDNRVALVRVEARDLPVREGKGTVRVVVAIVEDQLLTDVRRGENARRRLRHDAVARTMDSIAAVGAGETAVTVASDISLHAGWVLDRLRVVAFLQDDSTRRVLGAGTTRLE